MLLQEGGGLKEGTPEWNCAIKTNAQQTIQGPCNVNIRSSLMKALPGTRLVET